MRAGEGEVARVVRPAVLPGDDVFDLESKERLVVLVGAAILAAVSGPRPDERLVAASTALPLR